MTSKAEKYLNDYMERFQREVAPHIAESMFVMAIAPRERHADIKIALEIGYAILLEKPLVVIKGKDQMVSSRLLAIADHVIEGDLENDRERMIAELTEIARQEVRRPQDGIDPTLLSAM